MTYDLAKVHELECKCEEVRGKIESLEAEVADGQQYFPMDRKAVELELYVRQEELQRITWQLSVAISHEDRHLPLAVDSLQAKRDKMKALADV